VVPIELRGIQPGLGNRALRAQIFELFETDDLVGVQPLAAFDIALRFLV
jgi:hypothetical protein